MHHISKFNFPIPKTKPKLEMRKLLYPHLTWRSRELLERGREISLCAGRRFRRSESGRKNRPAPFGPRTVRDANDASDGRRDADVCRTSGARRDLLSPGLSPYPSTPLRAGTLAI